MRRERALGFTLIELALVILLISIFLGLGLSALGVQQTNRAFSETREKQETIKDALVFHLANFRRLPCPDTTALSAPGTPPDGVEDRVTPGDPTTACAISGFGVIPYLTLGLSRDDALDGWDNFFSYQVSLAVGTPAINEEWSLTATFFVGNEGSITLNDRDATGVEKTLNSPVPGVGVGPGIAAIIVSHGRNGSGAFTTKGTRNLPPLSATLADEAENTSANSVFFQREFTDVDVPGGGPFDDMVLALTPTDLLTAAINDGALPSATAQALSQVKTIVDTAFGRVPVSGCAPPAPPWPEVLPIPPGLPITVTVDPWGQSINYIRADPGPLTNGPPLSPAGGIVAFCAWSSGPDRNNDSPVCNLAFAPAGDDVGLPPVTYDQLRTAFSGGAPPPCP